MLLVSDTLKTALVRRLPTDCIASKAKLATVENTWPIIQVGKFLQQVVALANSLPDRSYAINLCTNRYQFLVSFCAVIVRGQCNLLPNNKNISTQSNLAHHYDSNYIIHDGFELAPGLLDVDCSQVGKGGEIYTDSPEIPLNQLCAITFTSGSAGQSKPNLKTWDTLRKGMELGARYFLHNEHGHHSLLATVPPQHMWGLETSIMLPLIANVCISDSQPLFPVDICSVLTRMKPPRILVTSPLQILALDNSAIDFPKIDLILCATAPLDSSLAERVEHRFGCSIREIYGCTEVGSIAIRQPTKTAEWEPYDAFQFRQSKNKVYIQCDHLPGEVLLHDVLQFTSKNRFRLISRQADIIKIGGKRGSLSELNQLLLSTPGVQDGVILEPPGDNPSERLVALVVSSHLSSSQAMANIRENVDPVFVPRRVLFVKELPRSDIGKLSREELLALYNSA